MGTITSVTSLFMLSYRFSYSSLDVTLPIWLPTLMQLRALNTLEDASSFLTLS